MSHLSKEELQENQLADDQNSSAKRILLAEDEPVIRQLLNRFLKAWGYQTLLASNGKEAMKVASEHPGDIDLLLTDVTMPEMEGPELAEKLTSKRPSLKVILMSGFSHAQLKLRAGWHFIQKPFKPSDVKNTLDKML